MKKLQSKAIKAANNVKGGTAEDSGRHWLRKGVRTGRRHQQ